MCTGEHEQFEDKKEINMVSRTADSLFGALVLDRMPSHGAIVDFGLDDPDREQARLKYGYLQRIVREGVVDVDQLHEVAGDGPALTKLVQGCFESGQCDVVYTTAYDNMFFEEDDNDDDDE